LPQKRPPSSPYAGANSILLFLVLILLLVLSTEGENEDEDEDERIATARDCRLQIGVTAD